MSPWRKQSIVSWFFHSWSWNHIDIANQIQLCDCPILDWSATQLSHSVNPHLLLYLANILLTKMSSLSSTLPRAQQLVQSTLSWIYITFGVIGCILNICLFCRRPLRTMSCCTCKLIHHLSLIALWETTHSRTGILIVCLAMNDRWEKPKLSDTFL